MKQSFWAATIEQLRQRRQASCGGRLSGFGGMAVDPLDDVRHVDSVGHRSSHVVLRKLRIDAVFLQLFGGCMSFKISHGSFLNYSVLASSR